MNNLKLKFTEIKRFLLKHYEIIFFLVLLLLTIGLRLPYIYKPFWYDEVWRANNLSRQPFFYALSNQICTPLGIGLFIVTRISIFLFGNNEIAIRLPVMLCGILIPPAAYILTKKIYSKWSAFAVMLIFSVFMPYWEHSCEYKPFVVEVLFILILSYLTVSFLKSKDFGFFNILTIFLFLALIFAAPVVFLFPGIFLSIMYKLAKEKRWQEFRKVCVAACILLLTSLFYYLFYLKSQTAGWMFEFWEGGFAEDKSLFGYVKFAFDGFFDILRTRIIPAIEIESFPDWLLPAFLALGIILSCFILSKRKSLYFAFLVLSLFITVLAVNYLDIWPFSSDRMNLFLFAPLTILIVSGFIENVASIPNKLKLLFSVLLIVLFFSIFPYSTTFERIKDASYPYSKYHSGMKDAVRCIKGYLEEGDNVVVYQFMAPESFEYYYLNFDYYPTSLRGATNNVKLYYDVKNSGIYRDNVFFEEVLGSEGQRLWIVTGSGLEAEDVEGYMSLVEEYGELQELDCEGYGNVDVSLFKSK